MDELMRVDGPYGGNTYEISELADSYYLTLTILTVQQATSLLQGLADKLGYRIEKTGE